MDVSTPAQAAASTLSADEQREISLANERAAKVRNAANTAAVNGWLTAIFAACSALFAFSSLVGFAVTVGLALVAFNEFRGRKRLLEFDRTAPSLLGWNQLGLLALIVAYCAWMLHSGWNDPANLLTMMQDRPEFQESLKELNSLPREDQLLVVQILVVILYGMVIVLSIFFQGAMAWYYFSRRKHVAAYVDETPSWVLELDRHWS